MGDFFYTFDILRANGDLRGEELATRLGLLQVIAGKHEGAIRVSATAYTHDDKRTMYYHLKRFGGEGVVLKNLHATYQEGRPNSGGEGLKLKFVATASVIVAKHNEKRSVDMALVDGTAIGSVTIPPNKTIPPVGSIIEVRYLYAHRGGSLSQAVYIGIREDVLRKACTSEQLQYKAEARAS
jgi:bifunctional non-homologous end joining protein LigD